jgi:uncharacterized protein YukE
MAWSVVAKFLMKIARKVLEAVLVKLIVESDVVKDLIEKIRGYFPTLTDAWEGEDRDAFIDDVTRNYLPEVQRLLQAIMGIKTGVSDALNVMDTTDDDSASTARDIRDAFSKVKV